MEFSAICILYDRKYITTLNVKLILSLLAVIAWIVPPPKKKKSGTIKHTLKKSNNGLEKSSWKKSETDL